MSPPQKKNPQKQKQKVLTPLIVFTTTLQQSDFSQHLPHLIVQVDAHGEDGGSRISELLSCADGVSYVHVRVGVGEHDDDIGHVHAVTVVHGEHGVPHDVQARGGRGWGGTVVYVDAVDAILQALLGVVLVELENRKSSPVWDRVTSRYASCAHARQCRRYSKTLNPRSWELKSVGRFCNLLDVFTGKSVRFKETSISNIEMRSSSSFFCLLENAFIPPTLPGTVYIALQFYRTTAWQP